MLGERGQKEKGKEKGNARGGNQTRGYQSSFLILHTNVEELV